MTDDQTIRAMNEQTYQCPLTSCGWTYTPPRIYSPNNQAAAPHIGAVFGITGDALLAIHASQEAKRTETELENHFRTHTPLDWVQELMRTRRDLDAAHTALAAANLAVKQ